MPAAITQTSTWPRPGLGVSMTSVAKDFFGSPKRSGRITDAYIFSGTEPSGGISPSS